MIYCNQKCSWWLIRTLILRGYRPAIYIRLTQKSNTIHIEIFNLKFYGAHEHDIFGTYMMYDINYKEVEIDA